MGDATPLSLPSEVPFPITVTRVLVSAGDTVRRGTRLLEYSFFSATRQRENAELEKSGKPVPPERRSDDMVGSWESPVDGTVVSWMAWVKPGAFIDRTKGSKPLIKVEQPCTHPVQIHGMCGVCGADLTNDDYLSRPAPVDNRPGASRHGGFELAHDASGVTVSTNEAKRLDTLSRDSLLSSRRLSLIVDLDQTIIHTTVDPTVGEWIAEIEEDQKEDKAEEQAAADKAAAATADVPDGPMATDSAGPDGRSTTPPMSPPRKREKNPNARALQDVAAFQLADDVPSGSKGRRRPTPRRWYFTKPRPGLNDFLNNMSELYEMHVYTMGTRTYADEICKVIDPEGKIFGGRILSRDESGSMSSKSLLRLFPTDQSMVVVIDDRSDVWGDCPNLVKVVPYDFFIGIGDINGSFLPPTQPVITPNPNKSRAPDTPSTAASSPTPETPPEIPSQEEGLMLQSKLLDKLAEQRPLAKLEEESEKEDGGSDTAASDKGSATGDADEPAAASGDDATSPPVADGEALPNGSDTSVETKSPTPPATQPPVQHHRKQLLNPEDHELDRVAGILTEIHSNYYKAYDTRDDDEDMPLQCDAPLLIQEIKDEVLAGCTIAFTGVIPRNIVPERSEIWQLAESFGAVCVHDLSDKVTHLVTATIGTEKMYKASKMVAKTGIHIVWLAWLQESIALWKHVPEGPHLAQPQAVVSEAPTPAPASDPVDAEGDVSMDGDAKPADGEGDSEISPELQEDASLFNSMWDDDAQAEFDKFMEEDSDDEDENAMDTDDDSGPDDEVDPRSRSRAETPSVWSRAATPGPSILSRAETPGPSGDPKHVRYADEENLPLEMVREPQPGDIPSYPPRKKPRLLVAPGPDDDVPEENKMVYNVNQPGWQHGLSDGDSNPSEAQELPASQETAASTAGSATDDEDDEVQVQLAGRLRALDVNGTKGSGPGNAGGRHPKLLSPSPLSPLPARLLPSPLSTKVTTACNGEKKDDRGARRERREEKKSIGQEQ